MKNVLVTGGNGFIGSALTELLIKEECNVTILVKEGFYIDKARKHKIVGSNVMELDLSNISDLVEYNMQFDTCYHFAWSGISGEELLNVEKQIDNIKYCINLLKILPLLGCNRFIGAGSLGQLDLYEGIPLKGKEKYYKCAKDACENFGEIIAKELEIEFIWPLITNSFGVGETSDRFINSLIKKLINNEDVKVSKGEHLYDFIYIDDLVNAFYLIGKYGKSGRRYRIGSGNAKKHKDWIENIPDIINSKGRLRFGEFEYDGVYLKKEDFDITSLVEDTGFKAKVSFEEGILKTADYIKRYVKDFKDFEDN